MTRPASPAAPPGLPGLRGADPQLQDQGFDWAERFDAEAKERMLTAPTEFATLDAHGDYGNAVPTPDHFIPALYLAGLAGAAGDAPPSVLVDGCAYGSISMSAYTLGTDCGGTDGSGGSAPLSTEAPADGANV